jgi:glutathione S-transferase
MSDVTFFSMAESSYLWTCMHVADEKGVSYELETFEPGSPEHLKLHPFAKMPVLRHRDYVVYESLAITHYLNAAFVGPALMPADPRGQAEVLRWVSIVNSYVFPVMNRFMKERIVRPAWGVEPDEAFIAGAQAQLTLQVGMIGDAASRGGYLVGDRVTLADSFLLPNLLFFALTLEGKYLLDRVPAARDWLERMKTRPSYAKSPMGKSAVHQLPPSTRMTWPVT